MEDFDPATMHSMKMVNSQRQIPIVARDFATRMEKFAGNKETRGVRAR
jgi:hypothetical protein